MFTEDVRAEGNRMEEVIRMAENEQGDAVKNEAQSSVHISKNSPSKRGRGRPQGSKKLKVCVTDVNLMELVSGISNGGSTQPQRGRGRPKLSKNMTQERPEDVDYSVQNHRGKGRLKGSKNQTSNRDSSVTDHTPKKRGQPKKSHTPEKAAAEDLANGNFNTPKIARGRPKGSVKRKSESLTRAEGNEGSSVKPTKRGQPKRCLNKKPRLEKEVSSEGERETEESVNSTRRGRGRLRKVEVISTGGSTQDASNGISDTPQIGRKRTRKSTEQKSGERETLTDDSPPAKRGRGRPKGSLNKKPPAYKVHGTTGRRVHVALAIGKHVQSKKQPGRRGRPRKYPLPSPEELKKPKVWKPLGRPRKYPRVDPPEGAPPAPRRSRGRPRKSESKKGAHLRKSFPTTASSLHTHNDGPPRKRGRPPSTAKSEDITPRKRGRPKGSHNKNKARSEAQLNSMHSNHSEKSDLSVAGEQNDEEPAEQQLRRDMQVVLVRHEDEKTLIEQASFEDSDQA